MNPGNFRTRKYSFPALLIYTSAMWIWYFLGLFIYSSVGYAQIKELGLPFINNYPKKTYRASTQNWSVTQNSSGLMYFANNDGLLEFDGKYWELYPMSNKTILRTVKAKGDTIFAGAFEEFGYFVPAGNGRLVFHSLSHLVPQYFKAFDEIWNIHITSQGVVFQSFRAIFIYREGKIKVIEPFSSFAQSFLVNGVVYVTDRKRGLMQLTERGLELYLNDPIFQKTEIRFLQSTGPEQFLLGTSKEGLFTINQKRLESWNVQVNEKLKTFELFSGALLTNNFLAFGTVQNGVYITDASGNIYQHLNRSKGLQNNTILSLFEDRHYNLWMGLDNGIDYAEISSPVSVFDYNYNLEATYTSCIFNGRLYAGTNQGLFCIELSNLKNSSEKNGTFKLIPGTEGQVWSLNVFDNQLICGHNTGCFIINDQEAVEISDIPGFWTFIRHQNTTDTLIGGTYNGLVILARKDNRWFVSHEVQGFKESSRSLLQDEDGLIWISHGYRGIFSVSLNPALTRAESVTLYKSNKGLPDELPYNLQKIDHEFNVTTPDGIYRFDKKADVFYKNPRLNEIFSGLPFIDKITGDAAGNYWFFTNTFLGVIRETERGKYVTELSPFSRINNMLLPSFENIFIQDQNNIFIGSQQGLIHFSPRFADVKKRGEDPVIIRTVNFSSNDSVIVINNLNSIDFQNKIIQKLKQPYRFNSVIFKFSSPSYEYPDGTMFAYRLKGYEDNWSAWTNQGFKEYMNLREGNYVFEVKSKNSFYAESVPSQFAFEIKPPLHRSMAARILYTLIFMVVLVGNIIFLRRRIEKARKDEIIKQEKLLADQTLKYREQALINEKEIVNLRNAALQNEMNHRNRELANTTLNLVHKTKILTNLKEQLGSLLQTGKEHDHKYLVSQLIRKINKEIKNEQHQQAFNTYFDDVHQDFILRLKETYPALTPKELRLCAYLRMNLSSKEIAPLMNISVRGLEISRYRLRKKLNIDHEVNLTDFILSL